MDFDSFIGDIQTNAWNVFGVEVYEDGGLTHTYGDTLESIHNIYSATKGVLSIAVGIASDEGLFDISKSILHYLPEDKVRKISQEQKALFEKITIRRLLSMFKPLSITHFEYDRCPEGYFYGASGTKLTVNELSKLGLLLYNNGVYEGQRILSEKYIDEATSIQQMNREGGYGYFLWKYLDGFSINGKWGQKCYVLPQRKLMISFLSHMEENSKMLKDSMEKHILGISSDDLIEIGRVLHHSHKTYYVDYLSVTDADKNSPDFEI